MPELIADDQGAAAVAIIGPTGAGKSSLGVAVAKALDGEVVSCDALQVYRGLDIGTGKISLDERKGVPHHLLDIVDPDQAFSAADYIRAAAPVVRDIVQRKRLPVVVGGTGLYLRCLMEGLFEGPGRKPELRDRISALAERRGVDFAHRVLMRLDPKSAARIHPNDFVRVARALEVTLAARTTMSEMMLRRKRPLAGYRFILVGLAPPREDLANRIGKRVGTMIRSGFIDEVRRLLLAHGTSPPAFKAIGYRELAGYLAGELSLKEAEEKTIRATVQYAKRQMTWYRREEGVAWFAGWGDDPRVELTVRAHIEAQLGNLRRAGEDRLYAKTAS